MVVFGLLIPLVIDLVTRRIEFGFIAVAGITGGDCVRLIELVFKMPANVLVLLLFIVCLELDDLADFGALVPELEFDTFTGLGLLEITAEFRAA